MMDPEQKPKIIQLKNGLTAFEWTQKEKPCLNHWYLIKGETYKDYWKITKDYYSPETNKTYYRIVEFYNGSILYSGKTLSQVRELMRYGTYRQVI